MPLNDVMPADVTPRTSPPRVATICADALVQQKVQMIITREGQCARVFSMHMFYSGPALSL
jgi:hypothetical protein